MWRHPYFVMLYLVVVAYLATVYFADHRVPTVRGKHFGSLFVVEVLIGWGAFGAAVVWPFRTRVRRRFHPPIYEPAPLRLVIAAQVFVVLVVAVTAGWLAGRYGHW